MRRLVFLYKGDEQASVELRERLSAAAITYDALVWSDKRATDAGFGPQLRDELAMADAIILCVGPKGAGFYQDLNEVDATIDALRGNAARRLLIVRLDGAAQPQAFARFEELPNPKAMIERASEGVDAGDVLRAALPELAAINNGPESSVASQLIQKTLTQASPRCLTIVVGPYAAAEIDEYGNTPEKMIACLLSAQGLPGDVPWLDVMGSVAQAITDDPDDAAVLVQGSIDKIAGGPGKLEIYLRMLAANWARKPSRSRLMIISCTPTMRLDLALRSSAFPVRHVRLVHRPRADEQLFAERIEVRDGRVVRTPIARPRDKLADDDRVVFIKPFGCYDPEGQENDLAKNLLISAEHWRDLTDRSEMPLPVDLERDIMKSAVVVLGAGAFSPSLHIVFHRLLKTALANRDGHANRYLIHSQKSDVLDGLHRLERALAEPESKYKERFEHWLWEVYQLKLRRLELLRFLANFDHQLNNYAA